mgnify:CR=1 FL=1
MAILIGEGGSSKVDWILINPFGGEMARFTTDGINPYYQQTIQIQGLLKEQLVPALLEYTRQIEEVYYYGAGCSGSRNRRSIVEALQKAVGKVDLVEVYDDLLGAARATLGREAGIVTILGTGQNSGEYDGNRITDQIPPLGFALGDAGSGASIGRKVIQAYFYREMPEDLKDAFTEEYEPRREELLAKVYGGTDGNRYVGRYARFAGQHSSHPFIKDLLHNEFSEMIERHLLKYDSNHSSQIAMVGSVSYYFKEQIVAALSSYGLKPGTILEKPIDGLIKYHGRS